MTPVKVKFKVQRHLQGYNTMISVTPEIVGSSTSEATAESISAPEVTTAITSPDGVKRMDNQAAINWRQAVLYTNMAKTARAGFSFVKANYGDLTGDYAGGVRLQESLDIASSGAGIVAGFALGGPIGGVAASVGVALEYATSLGNDIIRSNRHNAVSSIMRERYGITTRGGGR